MNKNYLKYNNLGILVDSQLEQVSQGNHNVDYYYIAYDVYDYTNGYVTVSVTLPDGTQLPELATSPKEFEFEGDTYKGFVFVLRDTLTAEAGTLSMTFNLKSAENDTQLCSSRLNVTIHESDMHTSPTITDAQYEQIQEVIRENTVKVDEALSKANDALYHDATIVKVNGEVQQTWDATYVQELYNESSNLLSTDAATFSYNGIDYTLDKNNTLTMNGTASSGGSYFNFSKYTNISSIRTGKETYFRTFVNDGLTNGKVELNIGTDKNEYFIQLGEDKELSYYRPTLEESLTKTKVFIFAGTTLNNYKMKMVISDYEINEFNPYNPNRHITNPQADLLKSEWEKGVNLLNTNSRIENQSSEVTCSVALDGSITLNGSPTSTAFINIYCNASLGLGDYVLHNFNSVVNANVLTRIFYNNSSSNALSYTETNCSEIKSHKKISLTNENYIKGVGLTIRIASGTTLNNFVIKPMLTKGTNVYSTFYPYNGSIIHEKDIESVLLWENGTPTNEFASNQYYDLSEPIAKGDILDIYFKASNNVYNLPQKVTIILEDFRDIYLSAPFSLANENVIQSRKLTFQANRFYAADAYRNQAISNVNIIPYAIYKRRFM